jgi:hypothetical protein
MAVLLAAALSACVGSLPAGSPAPTAETPALPPAAEPATPVGITSTQVSTLTLPLVQSGEAITASQAITGPAPVPPTEPSPPALPTSILAPAAVRDLALDYVRGAYRLDLPANAAFAPADVELEAELVQAAAGFAATPWQIVVGAPYLVDGRLVSPAVLANAGNDARWWGEVGDEGIVVTVVSARLPRPRSQQADGWVGRIVKLPPGMPFDDYFAGEGGNQHGIDSNRAEVLTLLQSLTDYQGRVRVWGELRFAAPDYNGRRLLARRIDLLDPPPVETSDPAATPSAQPAPVVPSPAANASPTGAFGPTGAIFSPLPRTALSGRVQVAGEAEGAFENKVIVRVETEAGEVMGAVAVVIDAAEMGAKGGFAVELPFQDPPTAAPGRVAVYSENPADGSLALLTWVNVALAGPSAGKVVVVASPAPGTTLRGSVQVSGTALGMKDETILVRVEDLAGTVLGQARSRVSADEAASEGKWQVKFGLRKPRTARPGRIAIYSFNPAADSTTLLATVDVMLAR